MPQPILFQVLRGRAGGRQLGRQAGGVGPFRPWLKTPPANGAWEYPDAFRLPRLPKPIVFAIRAKTNIMRPQGSRPLPAYNFSLSGVTRDSAGAPLGSCTVYMFRTSDKALLNTTVSDAVTGEFKFSTNVSPSDTRLLASYTADGTRAGITVDTLTGS